MKRKTQDRLRILEIIVIIIAIITIIHSFNSIALIKPGVWVYNNISAHELITRSGIK